MAIIAKILLFIYLVGVSIEDIRKREISMGASVVVAGTLLVIQIIRMAQGYEGGGYSFSGILVGFMLIFFAWLSRENIGMGDGVLFVVTGMLFGIYENCILLFLSLMFTAFVGSFLMVFRKGSRKRIIPFAPFVCIGYGVMLLWDIYG